MELQNNEPIIVGFCGSAGSGKDTAADYLVNQYHFTKLSFADTLKDVLAIVFRWDRDMLEGKSDISRKWREEIDEFWAHELAIPDFTPRKAMQLVGTDLFRNILSEEIWVSNMKCKIHEIVSKGGNVVISDCRFPNEIELLHTMGGDVIEVRRNGAHELYNTAAYANKGSAKDLSLMMRKDLHPSEWKWMGLADHIIDNDSTLGFLYEEVENAFTKAK